MTRIFITGVTGFAGSSLVNYFKTQPGVALHGHSRNPDQARKQFEGVALSIESEYTSQLSNQLGIDIVVHLAGIAHDLSNQYADADYYRVNDENTRKVYDAFLKSKATKFIFLSSIKAAVDISSDVVAEDIEPSPVTAYGKSKLQAERYIQSMPLPEGKNYYIFRPCMIHGPGNKGNLNLLYKFVKKGLPYPLGAFHNQRSFLNSGNFNFIVSQFVKKEITSGVYHLSDDGFLSTTELYETIATALSQKPKVWNIPAWMIKTGFGMIGKRRMLNKLTEDMKVSNHKLIQALGEPLPVSIKEGIQKTIRSFHD